MARSNNIARVVLDTPLPQLDHLFEYRIPEGLTEEDLTGFLVKVPLRGGRRFCEAWVVETTDSAEFSGTLSSIESVVSSRPLLSKESFELAGLVAKRQGGTVSDVLRHVVPRRYVRTEKNFSARQNVPQINETRFSEFNLDIEIKPGSKNALLMPALFTGSTPLWAQLFCYEAIKNLRQGLSSILCVPDFRDVALIYSLLETLVEKDAILRLDTKQEDKKRFENYLHSLTDSAYIVLGNRSSVLSPVNNLGGIYIWDEADSQLTEPQAPYYNARDIALIRQNVQKCTLTFASYSRSVAIQRLVEIGWLTELSIHSNSKLSISFIDSDEQGNNVRIPSLAWKSAKESLNNGPVLIQVAHAGISTALACSSCRERALCKACQGFLAQQKRGDVLQCRRCHKVETGFRCPHCQGTQIRYLNSGSEKTAEEIGKAFPNTQIIVSDGNHLVTEIADKPSIVIATAGAEPMAPSGYSAVIILDGLNHRLRDIPNADEEYIRRTAQALSLCRAGSKAFIVDPGESLGKTFALNHYIQWAQSEYEIRQSLKLPPCTRVASLVGSRNSIITSLATLGEFNVRAFGPHKSDDSHYRALIFFDYKNGDQVAAALKASIISTATKSRRPAAQTGPRLVELRVKMDDTSVSVL